MSLKKDWKRKTYHTYAHCNNAFVSFASESEGAEIAHFSEAQRLKSKRAPQQSRELCRVGVSGGKTYSAANISSLAEKVSITLS